MRVTRTHLALAAVCGVAVIAVGWAVFSIPVLLAWGAVAQIYADQRAADLAAQTDAPA